MNFKVKANLVESSVHFPEDTEVQSRSENAFHPTDICTVIRFNARTIERYSTLIKIATQQHLLPVCNAMSLCEYISLTYVNNVMHNTTMHFVKFINHS